MSKRSTPEEKLISFAFNADEPTLTASINTLRGIRDNRFPHATPKAKTPRAKRSDSGKPRGLPKADESAKPNGEDGTNV